MDTLSDIRYCTSDLIDWCFNYLRIYLEGMKCVYVGEITNAETPCSVCSATAITQFTNVNLCETCIRGVSSHTFGTMSDDDEYPCIPLDQMRSQLQKYRRKAYMATAYLRMTGAVTHKFDKGGECAFCASQAAHTYQWELLQEPTNIMPRIRNVCMKCHWNVTNAANDIYRVATLIMYTADNIDILVDVRVHVGEYVRALLMADVTNTISLTNAAMLGAQRRLV